MRCLADMTNDEVIAEARRRDERRRTGLPLTETPAEAAERIAEDDTRLEKEIQRDVVKLYRAHRCVVYNLSQARASKQTPGIGDLYVLWPEMHFEGPAEWWHETKTGTGKQSPDQREFQELCSTCDVGYVLGGVAAAEAKLRQLGAMT